MKNNDEIEKRLKDNIWKTVKDRSPQMMATQSSISPWRRIIPWIVGAIVGIVAIAGVMIF